jgi:hypothetical protein
MPDTDEVKAAKEQAVLEAYRRARDTMGEEPMFLLIHVPHPIFRAVLAGRLPHEAVMDTAGLAVSKALDALENACIAAEAASNPPPPSNGTH